MPQATESANTANSASQVWDLPIPFDDFDPPPFPTHVFPVWVRKFVEAESVATQTPPDLAGMLCLAAVASATARYVEVEVKVGWREPLNLYVISVLGSGNRKSAVSRDVTAPIEAEELRAVNAALLVIAVAYEKKRSLDQKLKSARSALTKGGNFDDVREAAEEASQLIVPAVPRLLADDVTSEKLEMLLAEQGGRMAVFAAEGDVFDVLMGRYSSSSNPNIGVFNKAHPGETIRVDRVGRDTVIIDHPALTVGLAVQPAVVDGLAARKEFRGRGLLARFLYSLPLSTVGRRDVDPPPLPDHIRSAYETNFTSLFQLRSAGDDNAYDPHILRLDEDATSAINGFSEMVEHELGVGGSLADIKDWAGKLVGAVARIAANLHLADHPDDDEPWTIPIGTSVISRALELGLYLVPHALAAFALMGADPTVADAKHILKWIIANNQIEFTKRDLFNGVRGRLKKVAQLKPGLALLEEHDYIRERPVQKRQGAGRPPSPIYDVNPNIHSQYSHNSQYPSVGN